jgi:hypothetical protein
MVQIRYDYHLLSGGNKQVSFLEKYDHLCLPILEKATPHFVGINKTGFLRWDSFGLLSTVQYIMVSVISEENSLRGGG